MHPFPFFVGRARSGTTLLQTIFDNHSQLAVPPESHFIVTLRDHAGTKASFSYQRFLSALFEHPRFALWELPREDVTEHFARFSPASYADAVRVLFGLYASRAGKHRYGDKTPTYVYHLPFLAELFPESRFVHIIRDGRDAALSFLKTEFASGTMEEAAFSWKVGVSRARRAGRTLGGARYREIRYEALVADPEPTVRGVAAFLDLDYEPAMLSYFERAEQAIKATSHPSAHQSLRLAPTQGLRDWRHGMAREDLETFELIAGDLLDDLGYELATDRRSFRARARAVGLQLRRMKRRISRPRLP